MDDLRFDRWTRTFAAARTRRGFLGALAGTSVALGSRQVRKAGAQDAPIACGGIAGLTCPDEFMCVDDPGDGCDPNLGGADCSGLCVPIDENPCAAMLCLEGTTCCPNCGGVCIPGDVPCSDAVCGGQICNQAICGPGEYCCNESCSRCVPLGEGCTREFCVNEPPLGDRCGTNRCGPGEYCCNESCGICTRLGDGCIELYCEPPGGQVRCGNTVCPPGEVCCNDSCGICTPPGGVCIALYCGD